VWRRGLRCRITGEIHNPIPTHRKRACLAVIPFIGESHTAVRIYVVKRLQNELFRRDKRNSQLLNLVRDRSGSSCSFICIGRLA
jgi:hypothetical protein